MISNILQWWLYVLHYHWVYYRQSLDRRFVIQNYTGQPFEDGRAFNKPNWLKWSRVPLLLLSITQVYQVYAVGWTLLIGVSYSSLYGVLRLSEVCTSTIFQHSESGYAQSNYFAVIPKNGPRYKTSPVYFTSVPTERFTLSDMTKDFAMGVQRDGEEDIIINIQGMYLRCYIAAIVEWSILHGCEGTKAIRRGYG